MSNVAALREAALDGGLCGDTASVAVGALPKRRAVNAIPPIRRLDAGRVNCDVHRQRRCERRFRPQQPATSAKMMDGSG